MRFIILLLLILSGCSLPSDKISSDIKDAWNSTCKIETETGMGSGVVLNTGFIITAGHVVDSNQNGILEYNELTCTISFDNIADVQTGSVLYMGNHITNDTNDIAIISIPNPPQSNISLISNADYKQLDYGERVFVIGMTLGETRRITDGRLDKIDGVKNHRSSCGIAPGNSGGGLFKGSNLLGIIVQGQTYVDETPWNIIIPFPTKDGIITVTGSGTIYGNHLVGDWSEYIPATKITEIIKANNLEFVVNKIQRINIFEIFGAVLVNLFFLYVLVSNGITFSKHILGKRVR